MNTMKCIDVTHNYEKHRALESVSLNLPCEGLIGLVGKNGSGKTTLMRLSCGQLSPTHGQILTFGERPMNNLRVLPRIVYTYHNLHYPLHWSIGDAVGSYAAMYDTFDRAFMKKLMGYFAINPKKIARTQSLGQAALLNFLCALACRASLTLMDEPVLGMDVSVREEVYRILIQDWAAYPRALVVSSHLMSELQNFLSHILILDKGRLLVDADIEAVRQMAYRVEGDPQALDAFMPGTERLLRERGTINSADVVRGPLDAPAINRAQAQGLEVSALAPEDLYLALTRDDRRNQALEQLWSSSC